MLRTLTHRLRACIDRRRTPRRFADMERMVAEDISDAIVYMVTSPRGTAINGILIRPTEQEQ
jgi:NADP-dependent 3-hydroxy acid dehydrogenase YdfG